MELLHDSVQQGAADLSRHINTYYSNFDKMHLQRLFVVKSCVVAHWDALICDCLELAKGISVVSEDSML